MKQLLKKLAIPAFIATALATVPANAAPLLATPDLLVNTGTNETVADQKLLHKARFRGRGFRGRGFRSFRGRSFRGRGFRRFRGRGFRRNFRGHRFSFRHHHGFYKYGGVGFRAFRASRLR